jgi:hypothetical protein
LIPNDAEEPAGGTEEPAVDDGDQAASANLDEQPQVQATTGSPQTNNPDERRPTPEGPIRSLARDDGLPQGGRQIASTGESGEHCTCITFGDGEYLWTSTYSNTSGKERDGRDPTEPYSGAEIDAWNATQRGSIDTLPDGVLAFGIGIINSLLAMSDPAFAFAYNQMLDGQVRSFVLGGLLATPNWMARSICSGLPIGSGPLSTPPVSGTNATAASKEASFASQMTKEEAAAYQKYWQSLTERAPQQSSPFNIINKYSASGELKGATTYDANGNRAFMYEFGNVRHGEGFHFYENTGPFQGLGGGPRSDHLPFSWFN